MTGAAFTLATVWLLIDSTRTWAHPFTSSSHGLVAILYDLTAVLASSALLVSVAALVVRFAKSSGEERQQLKWCAAAALLLVVAYIASIWMNTALVNVLKSLAFMVLWTAIVNAVLKYRLYDIDRIISRTLAYAIVTGLLIGCTRGWCCWRPKCSGSIPRPPWPLPHWPPRRCSTRCDGGSSSG